MGTWGVGLYQSDDAADLRDDLREIVRAPWDADRLVRWALDAYPAAGDPAADGYSDLRLALADLFWTYAIDHDGVMRAAAELIRDGGDLDRKRQLGMADRDLKRRARVLEAALEKWASPNPRPRPRRMLARPQPFVLGLGDCLTYPTSMGRVRNPYVTPQREASFYTTHRWQEDGRAAAIVLHRLHRFETFARYLIAILRHDGDEQPTTDAVAGMSILRSRTFAPEPMRRVHLVSTTRLHLRRMRVEIVGTLDVDVDAVEREFARELRRRGGEFANDAWTLPDTFRHRPDRLAPLDVDDPVAAFLR